MLGNYRKIDFLFSVLPNKAVRVRVSTMEDADEHPPPPPPIISGKKGEIMLLHRVAKHVGTALRNGTTLYGYQAACGKSIIAASPLSMGAIVTIGPEPHAQCARCFKDEEKEQDIKLPTGDLSGAVYDERGNRLKAVIEKEDFANPVQDTNKTVKEENYQWGAPIRRG